MSEMILNRESLIEAMRLGARPAFLFFWGHTPTSNGALGKFCFSQWFAAPFTVDGVVYSTAEHFMMAEKARLFGDLDTREKILNAPSPQAVKKLGRQVAGFDEDVWARQRFDVVVRGNLAKFSQNPALKNFLLETQAKTLVEASPEDRVWGIGLAEADPRAQDPRQWLGENLLGFALMRVRDQWLAEG